ncbi:nitrilase-related carbon-nitrogen hydrolase [Streptomyces sp. NPDC007070]|uniref:nitrilase-related carbon-nitrogen hydrolase n=1 Tax=Streptomyces sp. NPDC007070 TaxID=3154312 RepID=UPI0033C530AC
MANVVRAALVQATWTGDTESMVAEHERHAREAARIIGFQEVFDAPYLWEKYYLRPGNLGWPVFDTAVGKVGVSLCYDRHFPEGRRQLGLDGAQLVDNPSATHRGLSFRLWRLEQPAAAVANACFVAAINRVGQEEYGDDDLYGTSYFDDPRGRFVGRTASDTAEELPARDFDLIEAVRQQWASYRDRRPDAYEGLVQP